MFSLPCINMKTNIINIGNSLGIILPTTLLRRVKLSSGSKVSLQIVNGKIVIKPDPRQGWAEAAKAMNAAGDDNFIATDLPSEFEKEEWTW
jgi:antitoxin MazE